MHATPLRELVVLSQQARDDSRRLRSMSGEAEERLAQAARCIESVLNDAAVQDTVHIRAPLDRFSG